MQRKGARDALLRVADLQFGVRRESPLWIFLFGIRSAHPKQKIQSGDSRRTPKSRDC